VGGGVDFSQIPFATPPQVTALHVIDTVSLRAPFMVQPAVVGNERLIQEEIKRLETLGTKVVAETKELLSSMNLKGKVIIERGSTASSILKRAPKRDGLVVVGSMGLDALDRFMLGSMSTKVTQHAPCSVLVVKELARPPRHVVLTIDGSTASQKVVQFLLRKMRPRTVDPNEGTVPIQVSVVHVMPYLKYPEVKETGQALIHYYADKIAAAAYEVREALRLGDPADEVIKVADQHKADLIVCGAKGLGAIGRFLLGSVSTKIVQHSSCSVLLVR
jgi:nucleotide-binding universal stress UspA family protein